MGEPAAAATDLLDALNSDCTKEFSGPATIVLGDNGGCTALETDLHGTYNSKGVFSSIAIGGILHAEDHGCAASVQGETGSVASSLLFHIIRDSESNSSHHPFHACAHSRLDLCGVGSGVGVGSGACSGVLCGVLPGVADDVGACMDGPAFDGIRVASNSIQSFTEYHDNSCARLTALQNSRVERGPQVRGGTKRATAGPLRQVRLSAGKKAFFSQQQSRKLHEEMWASLLEKQGPSIFREEEIVPGCAVTLACPSCPDHSPEPPGPGRIIRNMLGWSQMEKTVRSGVWLFRGALQGKSLFSSLVAAGDWVRKGSYHTAWSVPCGSSCTRSYVYGRGPAIGPHTGQRCHC